MGGKSKQSQRTKNNVRPSSSGRSAELLSNAVRVDPGLMSTSGGKVLPMLFPTLAAPLDPTLNPDFTLCLKKLNKKDPITKTKALQELCELVKNSNVDDVVAILPSWAHYYRTLTTDTDHKVREAAQTAHGALLGASGRRAAPQLRALLPAWLQAQYDDYAPAAHAARASLNATFPESKLPDVISFCMAEVMAHLMENLTGNAEATLSKKNLSPEEVDLQAARLATASLQGLEFFVQHLPARHDDWLWAELAPLLQAPAFWKMDKHKSQQVRAAWYGALGRVVARHGAAFGAARGRQAARQLLAAPRAAPAPLWTCLLLLMRHVTDDAWLDRKDLLAKRIIDVLENGGWGDAKHLSTMLLPLLAYLPAQLLTQEFYDSFFDAVLKGLEKKSIMSSKSERQSWITSLSECLRYVTLQPAEYAVAVGSRAHRQWLERALAPGRDAATQAHLVRTSAAAMAALAKHWLRQAKLAPDKHDQLVRNFWQNVASTAVAQIDNLSADPEEIAALLDAHVLLLKTLKTAFLQDARKPRSIKFEDEPPGVEAEAPEPERPCDAAGVERYEHNLGDVVEKICARYFEFAGEKQVANAVFSPLLTLLVEFDGRSLYLALARHFNADSVYDFYDKVLRGWLAGDTMRCRALVDVAFLLLKHLSEEEQDALLDSFKQFPPAVEEWGIELGLAHPHRGLARVRRWLRAPAAAARLRAVCARALAGDGRARGLLLMGLAAGDDGEMMISSETVSAIMEQVCGALSPEAPALERLAGAAAALASELGAAVDCTDLALALFRLQLRVQRARLGAAGWLELRAAWQDAGAARPRFRAAAVRAVRGAVADNTEAVDIPQLEHVASLCPRLLPAPAAADAAQLLGRLLAREEDAAAEVFALQYDCIRSWLNCPLADTPAARAVVARAADPAAPDLDKRDAVAYANEVVFRAALLRALLLHREEEEAAWGEQLLRDAGVRDQLARLLRDLAVLGSLHDGYAFWEHYSVISSSKRHVWGVLEAVVSELSVDAFAGLRARLALRAAEDGGYWSLARRALLELLRARGADVAGEDQPEGGVKLEEVVTGNGYFHTLQATSRASPDAMAALRARYLVMLRSVYLAHAQEPGAAGAAFLRAAAAPRAPHDPGAVVDAYYRHQHIMLYESDLATAEWRQVVSNTAVLEYLAEMVRAAGWDAAAAAWDFTTISLCSLAAALRRAGDSWGCPQVVMLGRAVLGLFLEVQRFVGSIRATCLQREPSPHVAELPTEWKDIFAPDLHANLFAIILQVLGSAEAAPTAPRCAFISALLPVARALDWHALPQHLQLGSLSLERLSRAGAGALCEPAHAAYKYLAHALLAALAKPLVLHDAEQLAALGGEEGGEEAGQAPRPAPALGALRPALARLQDLVELSLEAFKVGEETCEMVPFTDSHSVALGYLLLADATYTACQLARGDLVHHYIELFREGKHAEALVAAALRLLPAGVAAEGGPAHAPAHAQHKHMFLTPPDLTLADPPTPLDVGRLACRCVFHAARWAGGAVRGWWGAAAARPARALERLLRAHVSPALIREQLQAVSAHAGDIEDAEVTVHWSTNEVECTFRVEERALQLTVALGDAHPLPAPRVSARGAPGHSTHWLAVYLAYQNGSVLQALRMWTGAVARRVEAAPQCYICYCRLHPGSGRLPRAVCHQCRNKFHTECLRKWFTTSSKSNCPLCRANF